MIPVDFTREMAADIVDAFTAAGMAGTGSASPDAISYTPPTLGALPQICRVIVNRGVQRQGDIGPLSVPHVEVDLLLEDLPQAPKQGGIVTVGAETWKLDARQEADEAISTWTVVPYAAH